MLVTKQARRGNKGVIRAAALVVVSLSLSFCGPVGYPPEPDDPPGAGGIVSLSPQITESVYVLGEGDRLVGVTSYCCRPPAAMRKLRIGTPLRPDIEKIITLRPALVLGSREANTPWTMERLRRLGLRVHYFDRPGGFDDLAANFLFLSQLLSKKKEAERIVKTVEDSLRVFHRNSGKKVLWQVGAEPLVAASTRTFADDIIRYSGCTNIIDSTVPYPRINREEALINKPDIIVLMDMGYNVAVEQKRWRRYLENVSFVVMDAYMVGSPTPAGFLEAARRLGAHSSDRDEGG